MANITQKNRNQEIPAIKLPSDPGLDSKDDLLSKSTLANKSQSLSELKFPSEEAKLAKVENLEKSLNDAGGTAIKIGLKGVVALNKAQQMLEDRTSQKNMRMQNSRSTPNQTVDPLLNLLTIFEMVKSSRVVKRLSKFFARRGKPDPKTKLPEPQPARPSQKPKQKS